MQLTMMGTMMVSPGSTATGVSHVSPGSTDTVPPPPPRSRPRARGGTASQPVPDHRAVKRLARAPAGAPLPPPHRLQHPLEPALAGQGELGREAIGTGSLSRQRRIGTGRSSSRLVSRRSRRPCSSLLRRVSAASRSSSLAISTRRATSPAWPGPVPRPSVPLRRDQHLPALVACRAPRDRTAVDPVADRLGRDAEPLGGRGDVQPLPGRGTVSGLPRAVPRR